MLQDTWHQIEVHLGYGELTPIIEWAKRNCANNWNYDIIDSAGRDKGTYKFYFKDDRDAVAFTLWKS